MDKDQIIKVARVTVQLTRRNSGQNLLAKLSETETNETMLYSMSTVADSTDELG